VRLNKKARQAAIKSAFSVKAAAGHLTVLDSFEFSAPKTKQAAEFLKKFKALDSKVLLISGKLSDNVKKSLRNLPKLEYVSAEALNPYELLWADKVFVTLDAVKKIEEVLK
jgi:large subunit ribosomal protein L4